MKIITLEQIKTALKPVTSWTVYLVSITMAYFIGHYSDNLLKAFSEQTKEPTKHPIVKVGHESVIPSLTSDRSLLIIDKTTGGVILYDEQIVTTIFKAYSSSISNNTKIITKNDKN